MSGKKKPTPTDTQRLDWLHRHAWRAYVAHGLHFSFSVYKTGVRVSISNTRGEYLLRLGSIRKAADVVRAAIDAAMRKAK